jgi:hypothetical protein
VTDIGRKAGLQAAVVEDLASSEERRTKVLADFTRFAELQLDSQDIDPAYPVLKELERGLDEEAALAFSLQYVAFYNLASTLRHWHGELYAGLPTGIERRGLRAPINMGGHLDALAEKFDRYRGFKPWLQALFTGNPTKDWHAARLQLVHGWPLEAPDMGNEGSSGPLSGLRIVVREIWDPDEAAVFLIAVMHHRLGRPLGYEQLETLLCDFHSMYRGHYYNGHDIDSMLEQAYKAPEHVREKLLLARAAALPAEYLGEQHSWRGIRHELLKVYSSVGNVVNGARFSPAR